VNMFAIGHAARSLVAQRTLSADMASAANVWPLARPPAVAAHSTKTACSLPLLSGSAFGPGARSIREVLLLRGE
jgi:hypothetical protein